MSKVLAALALTALLTLCGACASDEADHHDGMMHDDGGLMAEVVDPRIARMRALESQVADLGLEKAWSMKHGGDSGEVTRAWLDGSHLFLEVRNRATSQWEVHDIDVATGRARWIVILGTEPLLRDPHLGDGSVALLTANDSGLICVDSRTGSRFFNVRTRMGAIPASDATSMGPTVYVSDYLTGRMAAVSSESGLSLWDWSVGSVATSAPVLTRGLPRQLLMYGTSGGQIVGIPAKDADGVPPARAAWMHQLSGEFTADPTFAMVGSDELRRGLVVFPGTDGWLYGCDPATGRREWILRTNMPFTKPAAVIGDRVFARNAERLFCLDAVTGERVWVPASLEGLSEYERQQFFPTPEGFELAMGVLAANGERVLLDMGGGRIARAEADNGAIQAQRDLRAFDFRLVNQATDALILGTADGVFVAFR